jgi:hypothetical protein
VALATYLVFFAMSASSPAPFDAEVVAATTADAEFLVAAIEAATSLYVAVVDEGLDLLIATGVQSWQSGVFGSGLL